MFATRRLMMAVGGAKRGGGVSLPVRAATMRHFSNAHPSVAGERQVSIETAKAMPKLYYEMPNDVLLTMAVMGDQEAREERLIREIMSVDDVDWDGAQPIFHDMVNSNRKGLFLATLPYKIGIFAAVGGAAISIPMIFHLETVLWFNELYVTTDVPDDKDLETPLEVGSFAWGWMEPPLGEVSFVLLCLQYARAQLENLGAKPYTQRFRSNRAARLIAQFPKYNAGVVESFSEGDSFTPTTTHLH
jgi:hypothetical protein